MAPRAVRVAVVQDHLHGELSENLSKESRHARLLLLIGHVNASHDAVVVADLLTIIPGFVKKAARNSVLVKLGSKGESKLSPSKK